NVPLTPDHMLSEVYSLSTIQTERPNLWITGDVCVYWERGNTRLYVAPDVIVVDCPPPKQKENVYLAWSDPPLLFVVEFGSRSTFKRDTGPKVDLYEKTLAVPEYLYADPPKRVLRFWRMVNGRYRQIALNAQGRVRSEQLELWFGFDEEGFFRIYTDDGRMLLTHTEIAEQHAEEAARASEATARADAEAARANKEAARANEEAARANEEATRAEEEAARAEEESRHRIELERKVAELAAELERLKQSLPKRADGRR
ncbi:MAG TPA: Uma2 family endonuclease, partial [Armatimonadota bacterium]|nr:Uma2 family endonuclease [Armatimonadota bacterium]